jgi:hypothetical protein
MLILRRGRAAQREAVKLAEQLKVTRAEANRWRSEVRDLTQGLAAALDTQFNRGGLSGRHDLAASFLEDLMLPIDAEDEVTPDVSTGPTVRPKKGRAKCLALRPQAEVVRDRITNIDGYRQVRPVVSLLQSFGVVHVPCFSDIFCSRGDTLLHLRAGWMRLRD